jgi:hypothetical protein
MRASFNDEKSEIKNRKGSVCRATTGIEICLFLLLLSQAPKLPWSGYSALYLTSLLDQPSILVVRLHLPASTSARAEHLVAAVSCGCADCLLRWC